MELPKDGYHKQVKQKLLQLATSREKGMMLFIQCNRRKLIYFKDIQS